MRREASASATRKRRRVISHSTSTRRAKAVSRKVWVVLSAFVISLRQALRALSLPASTRSRTCLGTSTALPQPLAGRRK